MLTYSARLAFTLLAGMAELPEALRERHTAYLKRVRNVDGGWPGREGDSDLYYTGFALRSLAMLGQLTPGECEQSASYLRSCLGQKTSVVDFFSWLYSASLLQISGGADLLGEAAVGWQDRIAAELAVFRTPDGGYAKMPRGNSGSTYHTFLVALCHELIDRPFPQPERILEYVRTRRRDDGGYVEVGAMRRSGTNPTAAAVALLRMLATDAPPDTSELVDFLVERVSFEGGLCANGVIPLADLLSTFTGLWTLKELNGLDRIDREGVARFVHSLEQPEGGFKAGAWDEQSDVEYTFYGLGTLALLHAPDSLPGDGT